MDEIQVYKQTFETAQRGGEVDLFHASNERSAVCAAAIDKAVADSNYETNFYDYATAARKVIDEYGADRVAWVLAVVVDRSWSDGRYSRANREWARDFDIPAKVQGCHVQTHPNVLDGFIDAARKVFAEHDRDTPEKLARDYHTFMEDFDPYGYRNELEIGDVPASTPIFDIGKVREAVAEDARAIAEGGADYEMIKEFFEEFIADEDNDESLRVLHENAQALLDRLTVYGEQHHTERETAAPAPDAELVSGFAIQQSVLFTNDRGFAFAENTGRVQSYVTWQFTEENGKRDYYWGHYYEDKDKALADFAGRVTAYKEDHLLAKEPARAAPKPSILARLQEGKQAAAQDAERMKNAPKRDNNREV